MKRFVKSILGVTLLEIMLVLAIAAMIIVMSVRYYQSATTNSQANQVISQLQVIVAAADSLAQGTGAYSATTTTVGTLSPIVGASTFKAPWGNNITLAASPTSLTFTLTSPPAAVCSLVTARLAANTHWVVTSGCGTITYNTNT